jgi:archaemetzincin
VSVVYLVSLGSVEDAVMEALEMCLWQEFGFETRRLPLLEEPEFSYDEKRMQYSSELILHKLRRSFPRDARALLGVTEKDLFIPMLTFVFGHAQFNGTVAIVSLARLRQEFYGLSPNNILLLARAMKEAVHEVGHIFGLSHCSDVSCPMSLSNTIQQVDRKQGNLCKNCSIIFEGQIHRISERNERDEGSLAYPDC